MPSSMERFKNSLGKTYKMIGLSKSTLIFSLGHDISAQIKSYALANAWTVGHQTGLIYP